MKLAALFHMAEQAGLNEGIDNHFSAMVPGTTDRFLVNPYGIHWSLLHERDLCVVDCDGNLIEGDGPVDVTAIMIHAAIHKADPGKYKIVLHTHQPYATSICCTANAHMNLEMVHQNSCRFYGEIAYCTDFHALYSTKSVARSSRSS